MEITNEREIYDTPVADLLAGPDEIRTHIIGEEIPEELLGAAQDDIEDGLSDLSYDEEKERFTGSARYKTWDLDVVTEMLQHDDLADEWPDIQDNIYPDELDTHHLSNGFFSIDHANRVLEFLRERFSTDRYPRTYHFKVALTQHIIEREYASQQKFQRNPWYYATRPPRILGLANVNDVLQLRYIDINDDQYDENAEAERIDYNIVMSLKRSRPNHHIFQSDMSINWCGENALLRAFANINSTSRVITRLLTNILARDIDPTEIISNDEIHFWFQITLQKPVMIDPKALNKVTWTTDLLRLPLTDMSQDEMMKYIQVAMAIYLASFVSYKLEAVQESEYFLTIDQGRDMGHVSNISLFILKYPLHEGGGCRGFFGNKYLSHQLMRYAYDPRSIYNNCLFLCIYEAFDQTDEMSDHNRAERDRGQLNIASNTKIFPNQLEMIARYYRIRIIIYHIIKQENKRKKIVVHKLYGERDATPVRILHNVSHFCLIKNIEKIQEFESCPTCYKWFNTKKSIGKLHMKSCRKCLQCGRKYTANHRCKDNHYEKREHVEVNKKVEWHMKGIVDFYVADFETFQPADEEIVYAAGLASVEHIQKDWKGRITMQMYYGETALDDFCEALFAINSMITVVFYNGSGFDFWFILRWLLRKQITIKNCLREKKSNKILSLHFKNVKLWDLCLFTLSSLKQLCIDYGIPKEYQKKDFEHKKIKTWQDVATYKEEVEHYLFFDVLCLGMVHIQFIENIYKKYEWNAVDCVTLSHLAYNSWRNVFINAEYLTMLKLPTQSEHDFLVRARFGGRTTPYHKAYKSRYYYSWEDINNLYRFSPDIQTTIFNNVTDYLIYMDVVSLYPFVSKQEFPIGKPKWLDEEHLLCLEIILKKGFAKLTPNESNLVKRSYIEVDVRCPDDLNICFLLARTEKGELEVSLYDKVKQVYDGETLLEAMILGYKITKVYSALVYPRTGPVLERYMNFSFENKAKCKKTEAEYYVHKGMMNNVTGKFSQAPIDTQELIFSDDKFIAELMVQDKAKKICQIEWLKENGNDHLGYFVVLETDEDYNKPTQIGVSVLAKSRVLMSQYTRAFNGYRKESHCPYYCDTDSVILHVETYNKYKDCGCFGPAWGQLKDEFGAQSKIVAAYFPSPKTYALEYWTLKTDGTIKVSWYIKAKGIPKGDRVCATAEEYHTLEKELLMIPMRPGDLKEVLFSLYSRDGKRLKTTITLPFYFYEEMMINDCYVIVHYGSLKRYLIDEQQQGCKIVLNLNLHRAINATPWWKQNGVGKRTLIENHPWSASVPLGHHTLKI